MKTVLFVDKDEGELWNSFLQYDFVLDEYRRRGHFAVCDWHPDGRSVATAVPTLQSILGDEKEWTAVVVSDLRGSQAYEDDPHFDNPYDFERNYKKGIDDAVSIPDQTPPLVRLTQMLGGIPEKSKWELVRQEGDTPARAITHPRPDGFYRMLEHYRLGVPRPHQVICITPRSVDEDLAKEREKDLRAKGCEPAYQRDFWQRNDYAASTRFVVCDRPMSSTCNDLPSTEEGDNKDQIESELRSIAEAVERQASGEWLRFWVSVLTLLVADLPSDDLKPYRLYRLNVTMDFEGVKQLFDKRYSEWVGARDHVLRQMDAETSQLVRDEYEFVQIPNCMTEITVDFDLVNERELMADSSEVGILRDEPRSDHAVWSVQRRRIGTALITLLRSPKRALRIASRRFREQSSLDADVLEYCILNQTEKEELEDELMVEEVRLAETTGRRAFRMESYDNTLEQRSQFIHDQIQKRSGRKLVVAAFIMSLIAIAMGLIPYFLGLWLGLHEGFDALLTLVCFATLLALVTWLTLVWQQRMLRQEYVDFNDWMRSLFGTMRSEAKRLGERISAYATYRKRWSLLERQNHIDDPTKRLRWLGQKDARLQTRIRDASAAFPLDLDDDTIARMRGLTWSVVSGLLEDESFYNVYSPRFVMRAFNEGQLLDVQVQAPFEFVKTVELEPVQIW